MTLVSLFEVPVGSGSAMTPESAVPQTTITPAPGVVVPVWVIVAFTGVVGLMAGAEKVVTIEESLVPALIVIFGFAPNALDPPTRMSTITACPAGAVSA